MNHEVTLRRCTAVPYHRGTRTSAETVDLPSTAAAITHVSFGVCQTTGHVARQACSLVLPLSVAAVCLLLHVQTCVKRESIMCPPRETGACKPTKVGSQGMYSSGAATRYKTGDLRGREHAACDLRARAQEGGTPTTVELNPVLAAALTPCPAGILSVDGQYSLLLPPSRSPANVAPLSPTFCW